MGLQKVFGAVLFVAFFLWLHFWLRFWAAGADIAGNVCNPGGPFGILLPMWLLIGLSLAVLAVLTACYREEQSFSAQWPWLLVVSGGLGNLLERLLFGCIMDYVALPPFPAFNLADALLTIGTISIVIRWSKGITKNQESGIRS
ncbi:MAG: signal peptidase II [Patescibacteria group bacterium]